MNDCGRVMPGHRLDRGDGEAPEPGEQVAKGELVQAGAAAVEHPADRGLKIGAGLEVGKLGRVERLSAGVRPEEQPVEVVAQQRCHTLGSFLIGYTDGWRRVEQPQVIHLFTGRLEPCRHLERHRGAQRVAADQVGALGLPSSKCVQVSIGQSASSVRTTRRSTSAKSGKTLQDGFSASTIFEKDQGITYKDFLILPGYIDFAPQDVNLETRITRNVKVKLPLISSPMDTVTESRMAITMALLGGIGIIHNNLSIEDQAAQVERVKRYENGFITEPIVLSPKNTIADIDNISERYGFSGVPITEDGTLRSKLVGIVANRDVDFERDRTILLWRKVMTTELITAPKGISLVQANEILRKSKKGKLPIVDKEGRLVALMSRSLTSSKTENIRWRPKMNRNAYASARRFQPTRMTVNASTCSLPAASICSSLIRRRVILSFRSTS
jgi:IMP dehydrogenase/GMP reductase